MEIRVERNQRLGNGFQLRTNDGPMCEVYDDEPLSMEEALSCAHETVEAMNQEYGTAYKLRQVSRVSIAAPEDSTQVNSTAAHILQDIQAPKHQRSASAWPDVRETVIDGKKQSVVSGRGIMLMIWAAWKRDSLPTAKDALRRYCEYISAHGYGGSAARAMSALVSMDMNRGARWIKKTFARHIRDEVALIRYVLPRMQETPNPQAPADLG